MWKNDPLAIKIMDTQSIILIKMLEFDSLVLVSVMIMYYPGRLNGMCLLCGQSKEWELKDL